MAKHARLLEVILALLAALLGRRATRAWRHAPAHFPHADLAYDLPLPTLAPEPFRVRTPHDGTHLVCEHPILYVIGPGPNRGMRARARAMPVPRARVARAPP